MPQLRVSVTPLYLSATADTRELRALVSAVVWQIKAADVQLAEWIEFLTLADSFAIAESISKQPEKVFADAAALSDAIESFLIGLGKSETSIFTDAEIKAVSKVVEDHAALAETLTVLVAKVLADTSTVTDAAALAASKPLADSYIASDIRVNHFTKVAFSPYAEDYFFEEYTESTDYIYLDESQTFAISKILADTVNATDDVNGVLADDDQTIIVFKSLDNIFSIAELRAFDLSRPVSDSFSVADARALELGKTAADSSSFSDTKVLAIGLDKSETVSVLEAAALSMSLIKADSATVSENATISYSLSKADAASLADLRVFDIGLGKTETPTVSESFSYFGAKPFSNSASVLESAALQFFRPLSDGFSASDTKVLTFGLGPSDTATFTDSGSLLNQDYCEAFYFAEDYVGTSRTF